ncbi:MAG TPA: hypothetical protein VGZ22_24850, partial [Isosphaeraceae bacterium]|nr:hypothetical protein [Isosphaeraceae bacterium]
MSERTRSRYWLLLVLAAVVALVAGIVFLRRGANPPQGGGVSLPRPGSEAYEQMVSAFYEGVAALDVDARERAKEKLEQATHLVPEEPA